MSSPVHARTLRTLLPITNVLIIFLALLVERGESLGFYDATNESVVLVILLILVLSPLIYINVRNISRVEEALREAEAKFRTLVEQIPAITYIASMDEISRATFVSPQISALGFSPDEWLTGLWAKQLHPDDRERVLAEIHRSQASGEIFRSEYRLLTRDGQTQWYHDEAVVVRNSLGQPGFLQGVMFDITERNQAEEALRKSEKRFRSLIENGSDEISIVAADGSLLYESPSSNAMLGYQSDEFLTKDLFQLVHPDDLEHVQSYLTELLRDPNLHPRGQFRLRHRDGTWRWVEAVGTNLLNEPSVGGIVVNYHDITERVEVEAKLQASESRYRLATLATNDVIWEWNGHSNQLLWTENAKLVFGYAPEEVGPDATWWDNHVHPEDRQRVISNLDKLINGNESVWSDEYRFLRRDGSYAYISDHGYIERDASGKAIRLIGAMSDVTERKRAQEQIAYQAHLLANVNDAVVASDKNFMLTSWNRAAEQIFGWKAEEVLGHPDQVVIQTEFLGKSRDEVMQELMERGEFSGEGIALRKNGTQITIETHIKVLRDESGGITGFVSVNRDISERKQRERELEAAASINAALRTAKSLEEMLPRMLDQTLSLIRAEEGSIWLYDAMYDTVSLPTHRGWQAEIPLTVIRPSQGIPGLAIKSGEAIISREFRSDPRVSVEIRTLIPEGVGGICLPLRAQEQVVGVMFINVHLPREINAGEVRILSALADICGNAIHRTRLHEQVVKQLERLGALREIDMAISGSIDLRLSLNIVLEQVVSQLEVDAASILLMRPASGRLEYAAGRGFRTANIESTSLRLGEGYAGQAAFQRTILHIEDITKKDDQFVHGGWFANEKFISYFGVPLIAKGEVKGVLEILHRSKLQVDMEWLNFLDSLGWQTAIAVDNALLFEGMQRSNFDLEIAYEATIEGWSKALDLRDKETEGHTQRVTNITMELARLMNVREEQLVHIRRGGLLHDIGKMGVPDHILLKPGPLTDDEWMIMRMHPQFAYDLLAPISYLQQALEIPYYHHEKWDGTGYPKGLKGELVPLSARIFAVIDVWDALISDRPYRPAWPEGKARDYIRENSGTHFDPQVVKIFLNNLSELKER